jgi:hypothetical protein
MVLYTGGTISKDLVLSSLHEHESVRLLIDIIDLDEIESLDILDLPCCVAGCVVEAVNGVELEGCAVEDDEVVDSRDDRSSSCSLGQDSCQEH